MWDLACPGASAFAGARPSVVQEQSPDDQTSAVSTPCPAHHRATNALASVASRKLIDGASLSTPRTPRWRHGPPVRAAIIAEAGRYLGEPLAYSLGTLIDLAM